MENDFYEKLINEKGIEGLLEEVEKTQQRTQSPVAFQNAIFSYLPRGKNAERLYKAYQTYLKEFPISNWSRLKYNESTKGIYGSGNIDAGVINHVLKNSGIRVAVPSDDFDEDIFRLIVRVYYTDFNANAVQQTKPFFKKNNGLWRNAIELAEETNGSVKYPFMIQGFYNCPDRTEKNYGIKIVKAPNFAIIEDDRLSKKYNGWKFNSVDKTGLPVDLDKSEGSRTFHTNNNGLSRYYLDRYLDAGSDCEDLVNSYDYGRVVLVK